MLFNFHGGAVKHLLCVIFVSSLLACSDDTSTNEDANKKTVIDHQIKALEKAENIEAQILDAAQQQRAVIDAQGQ